MAFAVAPGEHRTGFQALGGVSDPNIEPAVLGKSRVGHRA